MKKPMVFSSSLLSYSLSTTRGKALPQRNVFCLNCSVIQSSVITGRTDTLRDGRTIGKRTNASFDIVTESYFAAEMFEK